MKTRCRTSSFFALALAGLGLPAGPALAQSAAWKAAAELLPGDVTTLAGLDVAGLRKWPALPAVLNAMFDGNQTVQPVLQQLKVDCGIDVTLAVSSLVVATDNQDKGILIASVAKVTEPKLTECIITMAKKRKEVVTAKRTGDVVEYSTVGKADKLYLAWPRPDIVAMASESNDLALLTRMLKGRGEVTKRALVRAKLSKPVTSLPLWFLRDRQQEVSAGTVMTNAFATAQVAGGSLAVEATLAMTTEKAAADAAATAMRQIQQKALQLPPHMSAALRACTIYSAAKNLIIKATVAESDFLGLISIVKSMNDEEP
jgi:hypothetical protein